MLTLSSFDAASIRSDRLVFSSFRGWFLACRGGRLVLFFTRKYGVFAVQMDMLGEPNRYTERRTGVARSLTLPYDPL